MSAESFRKFHLFQILNQFEKQPCPLDLFLNHYFRTHTALGSKDRKFLGEEIYGMMRWKLLLDHLSGAPPSLEKRYAIFQAFQPANFLYVNSIPPHIRISFPQELFELLKCSYGEEKALHLCQISNTKAPLCIRINPLKTTRDSLIKKWQNSVHLTPCQKSPYGIQLKERINVHLLPEYKEGLFEIQDEASQLVSDLVNAKPHEKVLDYCAGAGGKSLGFAHKMEQQGTIFLHDIRPHILLQARKRLLRAGIKNAEFLSPQLLQKNNYKMDHVLVDVPCSGTGTLRRNPDQKWRFSLKQLQNLIKEQRTIVKDALSFLKPGGTLIYATCSILKEENEDQINYFLEHLPLTLEGSPFRSHPTFEGMDGLFAAKLRKK